jgi:hypothetical protein
LAVVLTIGGQLQASNPERYLLSGDVNNALVFFSEVVLALDPKLDILIAQRPAIQWRLHDICKQLEFQLQNLNPERYLLSGDVNNALVFL